MERKNTLYARLQRSKNLPSLPQVLLKLIETCDRDDMHLSELSQIIMKDPAISSRVLTLVNSAYFGLNNTFSSLDQAVVYLGADTIKNISLTASVEQVFSKLRENEQFSMSRFWWDSFTTAIFAKKIARQASYTNVEEAYLAGLLHDLGGLLLWMNFPEECKKIQNLALDGGELCSAEEEQIGIHHCEAGAWLVRHWHLNSFIADTILYHHSSLERIKGAFPLVKIVYLAEKCCHVRSEDFESVYDMADELLGLGTVQIDEVKNGIEEEIQEVAESLSIKVKPPSERSDAEPEESPEHNLQLLRQVKNHSLLNGFIGNLIQAENRDAIFKVIEDAFNILFDVKTLFFFLHDFEQRKLYGCCSTANRYSKQLQNLVLSAEEGTSLLVQSMLEKKLISSLQSTDKHLDSLADSQLFDAVGGKGMLYVPMIARKRPVGVIVIGMADIFANDFSGQTESTLLQLLANQAAMSLYLEEVKSKQAQEILTARLATASMAAAKVVHEVNNPLGIIRNYLKILEMKLPEKDALHNELTVVDEEISRIAKIIQQLENFSTPVKHSFELININTLLANLWSVFSKSVFYSSRVQVHFKGDPQLPAVMTDAGAIKQIVINLVKNAAEAMKEGGNVYVKTRARAASPSPQLYGAEEGQDSIEITVRDDGPGLPETVLAQLFEPFTSTKGKGHSGLGLSIVRTLVTELEGSVTCRSDKEDGSCFTIILPIRKRSVS